LSELQIDALQKAPSLRAAGIKSAEFVSTFSIMRELKIVIDFALLSSKADDTQRMLLSR
jgi:hypothetical protein